MGKYAVTVAIPTIKDNTEQVLELNQFLKSSYGRVQLVVVREMNSAAINRNICIERAKAEIIVMLDDDISGFYTGWIDALISPLINHPERFSIVSARFRNGSGGIGNMLGDNSSKEIKDILQTACHSDRTMLQLVPTATIAFKKTAIRFDEAYIGAVYEDTDFCMEHRKVFPDKEIVINNACVLIHYNEQKRGGATGCVKHNRKYFNEKWGISV